MHLFRSVEGLLLFMVAKQDDEYLDLFFFNKMFPADMIECNVMKTIQGLS